ncbi:MAG: IreB family regulatory phosphoprotein [Clostridia bacterium]|nr:IreB family regulatory phosphoprotein [Clostridia bacterium]
MQNVQNTVQFDICKSADDEMKKALTAVYAALKEKGYNPVNQIVGYILSEDPTYITSYQGARSIITKMDRYELMRTLVQNFLKA